MHVEEFRKFINATHLVTACSKYEEKYSGAEEVCTAIKPGSDVLISIRGGGWNADAPRVRAAYRDWGVAWPRPG